MTQFGQTLRVRLVDGQGQPTPQVRVYFVAPVSGPGATLSAGSAITDLNGYAEITATANDLAGSYQVAATVFETTIEQTIVVAFDLTNAADAAVVDIPTLGEYGIALLAVLLAARRCSCCAANEGGGRSPARRRMRR